MLLGSPPDMVHGAPSHRTARPYAPKRTAFSIHLSIHYPAAEINRNFCNFAVDLRILWANHRTEAIPAGKKASAGIRQTPFGCIYRVATGTIRYSPLCTAPQAMPLSSW